MTLLFMLKKFRDKLSCISMVTLIFYQRTGSFNLFLSSSCLMVSKWLLELWPSYIYSIQQEGASADGYISQLNSFSGCLILWLLLTFYWTFSLQREAWECSFTWGHWHPDMEKILVVKIEDETSFISLNQSLIRSKALTPFNFVKVERRYTNITKTTKKYTKITEVWVLWGRCCVFCSLLYLWHLSQWPDINKLCSPNKLIEKWMSDEILVCN